MDQSSFVKTIEALGVSEKAAVIYVSLLGKNRLGIAEIARESKIKRATCYEHLDTLLNKDFVVRVPVGKRMYYSAVSPKKIFEDFRTRTVRLEDKMADMLRLHEEAVKRPKVSFYEGKREIKNIYDDLFKTVGYVQSIFPADAFFESFTEQDYDEFDKSISEHALKSRDLYVASKYYKKLRGIRDKNGRQNKLEKKLPEDFASNVDVIVYNDKVALISLRDLSAIVIENKDIADLFKSMHSFIWKQL